MKLYLVTSTYRPDTGVDEIMGKGAIPLNKYTVSIQAL